MILSKKEAEERLSHSNNLFNNERFAIARPNKTGRREGSHNLTTEQRATVGTLARVVGRNNTAEIFDLSRTHTSRLANATLDGESKDEELLHKINEKLAGVSDVAIEKLQMALGLISEEKLHNSKARELSSVAKDMASIADKARPVIDENSNKPRIIFYAPRFHREEHYETVEVKNVG